ncbi:3-methyl-2-oxobutanoate hydroxymethyltransferase [Elusimicrobiota bacterium]
MNKVTTTKLIDMKKNGKKITALTCYSYSIARMLNKTNVDIMLVGDSVGMVELGYENTLPVTVQEMIHHTKAVKRANPGALLITDMPYMSYNIEDKETLRIAGGFIKEGGAEGVKLEGGKPIINTVKMLVDNNVPVMGHLGLTPQSIHKFGGYKVQGKSEKQADEILAEAKMLEDAGIFSLVLEGMPAELAKKITESLSVPTIGIGAGPDCDGQILVINDMLGMDLSFKPKYVRRYANLEESVIEAVKKYCDDVVEGKFPSEEESY